MRDTTIVEMSFTSLSFPIRKFEFDGRKLNKTTILDDLNKYSRLINDTDNMSLCILNVVKDAISYIKEHDKVLINSGEVHYDDIDDVIRRISKF